MSYSLARFFIFCIAFVYLSAPAGAQNYYDSPQCDPPGLCGAPSFQCANQPFSWSVGNDTCLAATGVAEDDTIIILEDKIPPVTGTIQIECDGPTGIWIEKGYKTCSKQGGRACNAAPVFAWGGANGGGNGDECVASVPALSGGESLLVYDDSDLDGMSGSARVTCQDGLLQVSEENCGAPVSVDCSVATGQQRIWRTDTVECMGFIPEGYYKEGQEVIVTDKDRRGGAVGQAGFTCSRGTFSFLPKNPICSPEIKQAPGQGCPITFTQSDDREGEKLFGRYLVSGGLDGLYARGQHVWSCSLYGYNKSNDDLGMYEYCSLITGPRNNHVVAEVTPKIRPDSVLDSTVRTGEIANDSYFDFSVLQRTHHKGGNVWAQYIDYRLTCTNGILEFRENVGDQYDVEMTNPEHRCIAFDTLEQSCMGEKELIVPFSSMAGEKHRCTYALRGKSGRWEMIEYITTCEKGIDGTHRQRADVISCRKNWEFTQNDPPKLDCRSVKR